MARHLSRCLKPTLLVAKCLSVHGLHMPAILTHSDSFVHKPPSSIKKRSINYDESNDFSRSIDQFNYGTEAAVATLVKLLAISELSAHKAVKDYPPLRYMQKRDIYKNYQILREAGFKKSIIKDNKYLLVGDNADVKQKIGLVKKIDIDINDAADLLRLSTQVLGIFQRNSKMEESYLPTTNRIQYLAEKLNCGADKICRLLVYNPHMLHLSAPKLLSITELLLDSGMTPKTIMNDPWAYRYHISTIETKIERAKKVNITPLKPWVIRCTDDVWDKLEERFAQRAHILKNDRTIEQYLCKIFQCDAEIVDLLFKKNPRLHTVGLQKFSKIAQLLRSKEYTMEDIVRGSRIFHRSYETLAQHLEEWDKAGKKDRIKLNQLLLGDRFFRKLLSKTTDVSQ